MTEKSKTCLVSFAGPNGVFGCSEDAVWDVNERYTYGELSFGINDENISTVRGLRVVDVDDEAGELTCNVVFKIRADGTHWLLTWTSFFGVMKFNKPIRVDPRVVKSVEFFPVEDGDV